MRCLLAIGWISLAGCPSTSAPPDGMPAWREGPALPAPALEAGVTALGTRLVVLGGFDSSLQAGAHITNRVQVFDTLTERWGRPLPDAPVAWTHPQVAGVGGALYLLGGLEGASFTARGDVFVLGLDSTEWVRRASIPAGLERGGAAVVVAPPHIYLLGGAATTGAVATCLDYNVMTDTWSRLPDLPAPRSHPAAMRRTDGTLIVAGGLATLASTSPTSDVYILPVSGEAWRLGTAPMPTPRGGCAYGKLSGRLVCAGGEAGAAALHVVEEYDPITNEWSALPDIPVARAGSQGAVIGERLYIPGGAQSLALEPLDTLYSFSR